MSNLTGMTRLLSFVLIVLIAGSAGAARPPASAVATAHPLATAAAHEVLARGGNAFDAAVAASAALAVVEPFGSGLGGGGLFLLHRASDAYQVMVDGRERAPLAAKRDMYLDARGEPLPRASLDGARAAAIPGTPAALVHIAGRYGRLPLRESLAPAIRLAREGFAVSAQYVRWAEFRGDALRASPAAAAAFLDEGFGPEPGFVLRQPDLARTLVALAEYGHKGFYDGEVARRLVEGTRAAGGIWSLEDLLGYRAVERAPVTTTYRGLKVTAASLPSSGGLLLAQMLKVLEGFPLERLSSPERARVVVETMRHAYRMRPLLGDRDFVVVDDGTFVGSATTARIRSAVQSAVAPPGRGPAREAGAHTTHLSVLDREGNRVAATLTLNLLFGSGFMPPGTGVLLNNEMDDFSLKPGALNVYGLLGAAANEIAPGKRPLSSMTPTFLESERHIAILGTPGGSRIISMVLLSTLEFAHGRPVAAALVGRARFHHQDVPDRLEYEPAAFEESTRRVLAATGYALRALESGYGNMQAVIWDKTAGQVEAAADPRGEGAGIVR